MTNYDRVKNKVFDAIKEDASKKSKNYWWAYITALVDFNVITQRGYIKLRDHILGAEVVKKIKGG